MLLSLIIILPPFATDLFKLIIDQVCEQAIKKSQLRAGINDVIIDEQLHKIELEFLTPIYVIWSTVPWSSKVCVMVHRLFILLVVLLAPIPLVGCSTAFEDALIDNGPEYSQFASQQAALRDRAKTAFRNGDFAGAERTFRAALAKDPLDPEAWLGFAASSDRLGRFDTADKAYAQVIAIAGRRGEVVNNMGWSQWLRGNHDAAKLLFAEALSLAPGNPVIAANASAKNAQG